MTGLSRHARRVLFAYGLAILAFCHVARALPERLPGPTKHFVVHPPRERAPRANIPLEDPDRAKEAVFAFCGPSCSVGYVEEVEWADGVYFDRMVTFPAATSDGAPAPSKAAPTFVLPRSSRAKNAVR